MNNEMLEKVYINEINNKKIETIHLKIDVYVGSNITKVCEEAVVLANHLRMGVWFDFNGVSILVKCGSNPKQLEQTWSETIEKNR